MKPISRDQYKIVMLKPLAAARLQLKYMNGVWIEVNLSDLTKAGGALEKLADRQFFLRGHVQDYGQRVGWPNGVSFDAETLWERGKRVVGDDELTAPEGQKVGDHPGRRPGVGQPFPPKR